jgi:hypothetical protein
MIVLDDSKEKLERLWEHIEYAGTSADNPYALERDIAVFICKGSKFGTLADSGRERSNGADFRAHREDHRLQYPTVLARTYLVDREPPRSQTDSPFRTSFEQ